MKGTTFALVLILALVAVLLSACSVGPEYRRPDLDIPAAFRGQADAPAEASLADLDWWEMYRDKTLQQLLKTALAQNRDVRIAAARVAEARAQAEISRQAQWPQVDLRLSGGRGRAFQSGEFTTGTLFGAQGEVSFEIDLWRRLASLSESARANLLASESGRSSVRMSLVSDVATAYFNLLALDLQREITERTIDARERFVQLTQSKFRQGTASGLDLSRAEASLATARANLPELQRQIGQTENQLQILLGQNPAPVQRERFDLQTLPMPIAVPAGLPSSLIARRPDLREAEFNLIGATANVRAAKAALFPSVTLTGAYGSQSVELSRLFSGSTSVWSFGLNFLQPLLDAQRNRYQVEAARAREQQALLGYQRAVGQAFREVADALAARSAYGEAIKAQEQQVKSLQEVSARVLRRYQIGYSSYFEVIDADSQLFAAELQLALAYRNGLLSLVQLYKALGGGWRE